MSRRHPTAQGGGGVSELLDNLNSYFFKDFVGGQRICGFCWRHYPDHAPHCLYNRVKQELASVHERNKELENIIEKQEHDGQ